LLLADDSATIQKVVNLTFEDEGIEVIGVGDGDAAMERFSAIRPDIVLADVNMPGLSGYKVCENIRQQEDGKNTPVILLVGSFEPFDEAEARRVGATDVLTKPFQSIRQLVAKVTELLPKREPDEARDENNVPVLEVPEAQAEPPSEAPVEQDLGEIDNLYRESFAETVEMPHIPDETLEMPHVQVEPQVLGDVSMDDEMIETSLPESSVADTTREYNLSDREDLGFASAPPPEQAEPIYQAEEIASPFDSVAEETVFEPDAETEYAREDYRENEPEPQPHFDDEGNLLELTFSEQAPPQFPREEPQSPDTGTARFSQEFIDAIAQRVSEKITQNIIREIAWEVVPVIAESVIREKTGGQH
jgi:DNA-binding response OmpR family regulator